MAHGFLRRVVAVWDSGAAGRWPSGRLDAGPGSRAVEPRRGRKTTPVGLPEKPSGSLKPIVSRLFDMVSSVEQLVFLVLFLAFVGFAIHWVILIAG